jgi:bifunctional DNA-binding transcriptional regulator/antitoxin component of YhaV-PrlF toxin-antitoxin module
MKQLYQSKIFANGSTTLPKPMRDALGIKVGDRMRHVISEKGVQFFKMPLEDVQADDPVLREALDAAKKVLMKTTRSCESLTEFWFPKSGTTRIKQF